MSADVTSGKLLPMKSTVRFTFSRGEIMIRKTLVNVGVGALLGGMAVAAQAATVKFENWAYPPGSQVNTNIAGHTSVWAGGFTGNVSFTGTENGFSGTINPFLSYCVEITESFSGFPSANMAGYNVLNGFSYSHWANANGSGNTSASTALRLGRLLTYVSSNPSAVDSATESTAMQLAIWNVIYDNDSDNVTAGFNSVANGSFASTSASFTSIADALLDSSRTVLNKFDVFVLQKSGSQDFILVREESGGGQTGSGVPEPASLALSLMALGAMGVASRRRKTSKS
jgi:hypothetical protein